MKEILQTYFFDNTVELYLEVFGVILVAFIIKRILSKYLAGLLFRVFSKPDKKFRKKEFIELIVGPLDNFLFVLIIIIAMDKLTMPAILNAGIYKVTIKDVLDAVVHTALIVSFIRLCVRLVKFLAIIFEEKANLTPDQSDDLHYWYIAGAAIHIQLRRKQTHYRTEYRGCSYCTGYKRKP
ncbi:MAG: hypothetical protein ABI921_12420 [Panacibacter sp.]